MDDDAHALGLGRLIANLQSLELMLRAYLALTSDDEEADGRRLIGKGVGDKVPEDPFTDYDSLRQVIRRYNAKVADPELSVSEDVVEIRDALAHGRISAWSPEFPLQLLTFAKPQDATVEITQLVTLTEEWFAEQRRHVFAQAQKVERARRQLG